MFTGESLSSGVAAEIVAGGILTISAKGLMMIRKRYKDEEKVITKPKGKKIVWSPSIMEIVVNCVNSNCSPKQTVDFINSNAPKDDLAYFHKHFEKSAIKKEENKNILLEKRVKTVMKEAKEILRYGDDAISDWVNNANNARSYVWRAEKKKQFKNNNL